MTSRSIRLFQTADHRCGYYPERVAQDVLLDPHDPALPALYPAALAAGFRRSGGQVYQPRCRQCRDCRPLRLEVARFRPDRSQRRCLQDNAQLQLSVREPYCDDAVFSLYRAYLGARHAGGGMDAGNRFDFEAFVRCDWSPTRFFELREGDRLLAVAVTDVLPEALSAVYTFFDPGEAARGLGTLAILRQIEWAREHGRQHLYLGFWIAGHPKMHYKSRYRPAELMQDGAWRPLTAP